MRGVCGQRADRQAWGAEVGVGVTNRHGRKETKNVWPASSLFFGFTLQCSCLENPRDGGAWWTAAYGVTQSQTRLKRLSSSSCKHYIETGILLLCVPKAQDKAKTRDFRVTLRRKLNFLFVYLFVLVHFITF